MVRGWVEAAPLASGLAALLVSAKLMLELLCVVHESSRRCGVGFLLVSVCAPTEGEDSRDGRRAVAGSGLGCTGCWSDLRRAPNKGEKNAAISGESGEPAVNCGFWAGRWGGSLMVLALLIGVGSRVHFTIRNY